MAFRPTVPVLVPSPHTTSNVFVSLYGLDIGNIHIKKLGVLLSALTAVDSSFVLLNSESSSLSFVVLVTSVIILFYLLHLTLTDTHAPLAPAQPLGPRLTAGRISKAPVHCSEVQQQGRWLLT